MLQLGIGSRLKHDDQVHAQRIHVSIHMLLISAAELCRVLGADKGSLTQMELAVREAIEAAHTPDEVDAIRTQACLSAATPTNFGVTKKGKVSKI